MTTLYAATGDSFAGVVLQDGEATVTPALIGSGA